MTDPATLKDRLLAKAAEYDNDLELHQLATDVHMMEFQYHKLKGQIEALRAELAPYLELDHASVPDDDYEPGPNARLEGEEADDPDLELDPE